MPVQRIGVAEAARGDARPGLGNQFCGPGQRPSWPVPEGIEERSCTEFKLPVGDHPGGELGLRAATALEATDPAARQPAPPQLLLALDAGEFQHGARAGYLDKYAAEIEQHQINGLSHASNLPGGRQTARRRSQVPANRSPARDPRHPEDPAAPATVIACDRTQSAAQSCAPQFTYAR